MNFVRERARGLLLVGLALALLVVSAMSFEAQRAYPVQAAAVTPAVQTSRGPERARVAEFFDNRTITVDTRACFDLAEYEIVDLQYKIDQGTVNTVTLSIQQSNDNVTFNTANTVVSANAADANALLQFPLFGRWNCVNADLINSNPLTLTVIGVVK